MKKVFLILLLCSFVQAAEQVRIIDNTGREVNPGASDRWPVSHLNAGTAGVKMLLTAPGNTKSHYVTGYIMTGGAATNGFYLLRQNCVLLDSASANITLATHATDYDWGTFAANGDFSAEFWINLEATTVAVPSLMKRGNESADGWLIELTSDSFVKFTFHDGANSAITLTATTAIDDGEWHYIVCVVDRSSTSGMQIYVDGIADATAVDPTGNTADVDGGTTIVMTGVSSEIFYISVIGIYTGTANGVLTASTILTRYNSGIGFKLEGDEAALQAGFNLDEGSGSSGHDIKNDTSNVITLNSTSWSPSRQNGATVEVNVDGIPINERNMMRAVGKFTTGVGSDFSGTFVKFPHPVRIGLNSPMNILETNGAFNLIVFGYTQTK